MRSRARLLAGTPRPFSWARYPTRIGMVPPPSNRGGSARERHASCAAAVMTTSCERELRSLLQGEIAAAETYAQVLDDGHPLDKLLRQLQHDHGRAIRFLSEQLSAQGCEVPASSGAWGRLARVIEGGAKLLGRRAALAALREGERRGLVDYETAAGSAVIPRPCRMFIANDLLPAQRRHVAVLDRLLQQA